MTEDFIHYIWKYRLFNPSTLTTTEGLELRILSPGIHNTDSGPDFFNARIIIGTTEWAGNVEIHTRASDWHKHTHHTNKAYDSVILHVVYENDIQVARQSGSPIPTLCLKGCFDETLLDRYKKLISNRLWIPCANSVKETDAMLLNIWLEKLVIERLMLKAEAVKAELEANKNNWEDTFLLFLCRNFGFKINAEPFEILARNLPSIVIGKHRNSLFQLEALLFGQAGLLNAIFSDDYPASLQKEYYFLSRKFSLKPMNESQWHLMRLRPHNFPQLRLAQLATLLHKHQSLFSKIIETDDYTTLLELFRNECSPYWHSHFLFEKKSQHKKAIMGDTSIQNIIINTVVVFLVAYGNYLNEDLYRERALRFLNALPAESNSIITGWSKCGITAQSASDSQALIELKRHYCTPLKCLNCMIGDNILRKK